MRTYYHVEDTADLASEIGCQGLSLDQKNAAALMLRIELYVSETNWKSASLEIK